MRVVFGTSLGELRSLVLAVAVLTLAFVVGMAMVSVVGGTTVSAEETNDTHGSDRQVDDPKTAGQSDQAHSNSHGEKGDEDSPERNKRGRQSPDGPNGRDNSVRATDDTSRNGDSRQSTNAQVRDERANATSGNCIGWEVRTGQQVTERASDSSYEASTRAKRGNKEMAPEFGHTVQQYAHKLDNGSSQGHSVSKFVTRYNPGYAGNRTTIKRIKQDWRTGGKPNPVAQDCNNTRTAIDRPTGIVNRTKPTGDEPWIDAGEDETSQSGAREPDESTTTESATAANEETATESTTVRSSTTTTAHGDSAEAVTTTDTPDGETVAETEAPASTGGGSIEADGSGSANDAYGDGTATSSGVRDSASDFGDGNDATGIENDDKTSVTNATGTVQPSSSVSTDTTTATHNTLRTNDAIRRSGPISMQSRFNGVHPSLIPLALLLLVAALFTRRGDGDG